MMITYVHTYVWWHGNTMVMKHADVTSPLIPPPVDLEYLKAVDVQHSNDDAVHSAVLHLYRAVHLLHHPVKQALVHGLRQDLEDGDKSVCVRTCACVCDASVIRARTHTRCATDGTYMFQKLSKKSPTHVPRPPWPWRPGCSWPLKH